MSADAEVDAHDDWDAASRSGRGIAELGDAHALPAPILGSAIAPTLFGIALPCGLNSTVTATLAGQAVMEGYLEIRLPPWLRRLVTRLIAIAPAVCMAIAYGKSGTEQLLILSQAIVSLPLPFAVILFVFFTASRRKIGALVAPRWMIVLAGIVAIVLVTLDLKLIVDFVVS